MPASDVLLAAQQVHLAEQFFNPDADLFALAAHTLDFTVQLLNFTGDLAGSPPRGVKFLAGGAALFDGGIPLRVGLLAGFHGEVQFGDGVIALLDRAVALRARRNDEFHGAMDALFESG
jgi:hypothetical protein